MSKIKINFNELINSYQENLLIKLRGFGEADFLKYWVPGSNNQTSLINLIDALVENNNLNFEILLDSKLHEIQNLGKFIINLNNKIGIVDLIEDNLENQIFSFSINIKNYKYFYQEELKKIKNNKISVSNFFPIVQDLNKIKIDYEIHSEYISNIENKKINELKNYKELFDCKNFLKLDICNIKIFLKINNDIIVEAYHNSKDINHKSIIVDQFVSSIVSLPFQEVAEHSVIYLENFFRPKNFKYNIKGIILPYFGGSVFQDLNDSVRNLFRKYQLNKNNKRVINKYYPDLSASWKNLPNSEKIKTIRNIIDECNEIFQFNKGDLEYSKLELDFRIILDISDNLKEKLKVRNYLIEIEEIMKSKIDPRLELFVIEIYDKNKLRHKNSPIKIK